MVSRSPVQMFCRVIVLISLLMALRVVVTVWGDSGWQLDRGQMGKVGEEACDALWLAAGLSMDILMLDMAWVIVVLVVEVAAEVLMFQRVSPSWMTASSRDKIVEFVSGVRQVPDQIFQFKGSQGERG
jgi:hypothetical protein